MHAAVFVDFENLFASLESRSELTGTRTRDLALHILENLKIRLREEGVSTVIGRSYAAFDTYPGMEAAHDLALMGFDPQYVLVGVGGKNSADVQLAVDVCRILYRRADIEAVVIVSGDRDFIPIARQVLEENRELRLVAIPDSTSGDLRMRVGTERFWNALDLVAENDRGTALQAVPESNSDGVVEGENGLAEDGGNDLIQADGETVDAHSAAIVGHIPVTWRTSGAPSDQDLAQKLAACLDLIVKAQIRHGSREIWLSPFLKGPMSQQFSSLVHPERRALINELRNRGVIRVEERENQFADHPYSVIVLDEENALAKEALMRGRKGS